MPLVGIQYGASQLRWTEAMQLAREDENFAYPPPLLAAMQDNREDSIPTASVIAGCLRQFALKRRVEYYERPNGLLPPIFGTAFHAEMEKYTEHDPREVEDYVAGGGVNYTKGGPRHKELLLRATVDLGLPGYAAVPVTGRCDYLHEGVLLRDWKSKKYIPKGFKPPRENQTQVNIYNWLASEDGYTPAKEWELVYVSQDWVQRFRRPMKDVALVGNYVVDRLRIWAAAEAVGGLPAPVPAFFAEDAGKVPFPCSHCPVREACLVAFREETEAPF
jgi:hypothetical protein